MSDAPAPGPAARSEHARGKTAPDLAATATVRPSARIGDAAERIQAARRSRARRRARQAVATQRRPSWMLGEASGRLWVGFAMLALVGAVVWVEIGWMRASAAEREAAEAARRERESAALAAPSAPPSPTPIPEVPHGPVVSSDLIEANGPIFGCTFFPRLDDLRARIGDALVGACVENARPAGPGETRQRTTRGELVWWDGERRAIFSNESYTWITGPAGIVRRRNEERFAWEPDADAGPRPVASTYVPPPALPGAVLPAQRIVSYYGNPLSGSMGVLGEQPPEKTIARLRAQVEAYAAADRERPATPALELVAIVAQPQPGPDGLYRLRMETELIERVASWADEHGFLLILDVQTGRGNLDEEVRWLLPFLERPNVHLALDPEFSMPKHQVPGERIGTMDAAAINGAQRTLADLVESKKLPPKLLLVHRFTEDMVTGHQKITADPRVQVVMVMDGFGAPGIKTRQYEQLIVEQRVQYTGFKLFYRQDDPLMTPEQVLLLDPPPDLIIYQ